MTRGNGHSLKYKTLKIKKNKLLVVAKHYKKFPRHDTEPPFLEMFKTQVDKALSNQL